MSSAKSTTSVFEDFKINVKLKISALWVAVMFCYLYGDYIQLYVPGILARAMELKTTASDTNTQLEFVAVAIFMAIPSIMVFFSLVLKPKVNRWLNIILGIFFIFVNVVLNLTETWAHYLFLTVIEIAITMAIIWYAWKWPKTDSLLANNV